MLASARYQLGGRTIGRTPKPLTILVHPDLAGASEIAELAAKGHTILVNPPNEAYETCAQGDEPHPYRIEVCDLVLGPNCFRMVPRLLPYLDLAVRGARAIKYPKKAKETE